MAAGGTEAFLDLGKRCQHPDCSWLNFLPLTCDGCKLVFCLEHRSYKSRTSPKSDHKSRKVATCKTCSMSSKTTCHVGQDEEAILEKHHKFGKCDLNKKKPIFPVKRCKEVLTFSNNSTRKTCHMKVCLKHDVPINHACGRVASASMLNSCAAAAAKGWWNNRFLAGLASRNVQESTKSGGPRSTSPHNTAFVEAY